MIIPGPILVDSPKPRPLRDQESGSGQGKEEACEHMTGFGGGQRDEGSLRVGEVGSSREVVMDRDGKQEGAGEEDQGDMPIPAQVAAPFVVVQAQSFGRFSILFDVPPRSNGLDDRGQGHAKRGEDQVKGQLGGIIEATTDDQEVACIHAPGLHPGQDGPIKEAFSFSALALAEPLPVPAPKLVVRDAAHIAEQNSCGSLHADHFGAGDSHGVGVALLLEPLPQVRTVAVDGIGDDPADG